MGKQATEYPQHLRSILAHQCEAIMKFTKQIIWDSVGSMNNRIRILYHWLGVDLMESYDYAHYEWKDMPSWIKRATWGIDFYNPPYSCLI